MSAGSPRGERLARVLCSVAVRLMPAGSRDRYAEEWRADVSADADHAVAYAVSVLLHAPMLRLTLDGVLRPELPRRCQLNVHHDEAIHDNPENRHATAYCCTRCGRIRDDWRRGNRVVDSFAWTNSVGR